MNDPSHSAARSDSAMVDLASGMPEFAPRRSPLPFVACTILLTAAAGFMTVGKRQGWLQLVKQAVPLQKPLDRMDLGPAAARYRLTRDPPLTSDMEHELGTKEYAGWLVEDTQARPNDPWKFARLFISYYTGKPDQVPHVPEECLYQSGLQGVDDSSFVLDNPALAPGRKLHIRSLLFRRPHDMDGQRIYYTFFCNGDSYDNRNSVRGRMINFTERYLYYSKIELSYPIDTRREPREILAGKAHELLDVVIPVLVRDHWPDWSEVMRRQGAGH